MSLVTKETAGALYHQQLCRQFGIYHAKSILPNMAPELEDDINDEKNPRPLDEDDIVLLKTYGLGPYSTSIKKSEKEIKEMAKKVNDLCGKKARSGSYLS